MKHEEGKATHFIPAPLNQLEKTNGTSCNTLDFIVLGSC
jgi:hypothetical protein